MTKAILIGATSSGIGKTSFCIGLAVCLQRRGLRVRICKSGPDYLDPTWLSLASGRTCKNLDLWMHGSDGVLSRFQEACHDADLCIVEGAMGLYDGISGACNDGSSAALARILNIPVLLLADAKGCARSFAATMYGFTQFPDAPQILGYVANRIGSTKHRDILKTALQSLPQTEKFFGALPNQAFPSLESRHLGLHSASSSQENLSMIQAIGNAVEQNIDIDQLLSIIPEHPISSLPTNIKLVPRNHCRIAIAQDEAFCFYYPEWVTALKAHGAEVLPFSPLQNQAIPDQSDALILGGGYPELHAGTLSNNTRTLDSIRMHAQLGKAIYAECGGLMYLSKGIKSEVQEYPLLGILPAWTIMGQKLSHLGYVQAKLRKDCLLGSCGDVLRGHEFHYSHLESAPENWECAYECTDTLGGKPRLEGWGNGNILASYVHFPIDVFPMAIQSLIQHCTSGKSL